MHKLTLLFVMAVLTGCAAMGIRSGVSDESKAKIKNIAVASLLGDHFNHVYIGSTAFKNKAGGEDVGSWKIDSFTESEMVKDLKENSQFQKIGVVKRPTLTDVLKEAKLEGYDTAVVMAPSRYDNAPLIRPGYGIHKTSNIFGQTSVDCYLLSIVRVYDTTSGAELGWQWSFNTISGHPSMACSDKVEWKDNFSDYNAEDLSKIQRALKEHVVEAVKYSLEANGLTGKTP